MIRLGFVAILRYMTSTEFKTLTTLITRQGEYLAGLITKQGEQLNARIDELDERLTAQINSLQKDSQEHTAISEDILNYLTKEFGAHRTKTAKTFPLHNKRIATLESRVFRAKNI